MNSLFLKTLNNEKSNRPPFWFMRQAGRYLPEYRALREKADGFMNLCLNSKLACEVTLQPISRFNPDAAILFSDILVVPYGLGVGVDFVEGKGPILDAVNDKSDLARLNYQVHKTRIESTYDTVQLCREKLSADKVLIGFAGSPWTVATYMVEGGSSKNYVKVKSWAYKDKASFSALIEIIVDATIQHLIAQIESGAEVIKLFDSWAGVLSPKEFKEWVILPTKEICEQLKSKYPSVKIIGFPRGAGPNYLDYVNKTSIDAVAIDTNVCPLWAANSFGKEVIIQGNLDPVSLIAGGDAMLRETSSIIKAMGSRPHIFNLGHGVLPETPPENVERLAAYIHGIDEG